jgi:diadenosine tetraphosphatase ApaH/serine/threonine PP2A family protein phosphatase
LQFSFSQAVKEAMESPAGKFAALADETAQLLRKENKEMGNFRIQGKLVKLKASGTALVVGDLHGDLDSLVEIVQESGIIERMAKTPTGEFIVFLGDYGDRGMFSAEVWYTVLKIKLHFPRQVILIRGNHEGPRDLLASPHDMPMHFQMRFGEKWSVPYSRIASLFDCLYTAVTVEQRYLMVHGGLPEQMETIEDLAYANATYPGQTFLEEILWSDPEEMMEKTCPSPRGAGKLFGKKITDEILRKLDVNILIRGHEPCEEGFKMNHDAKILTLFSRKGSPYFNTYGAYLDVDLSKKFEDATQLAQYIHRF